jgi:hypothetical protein
MIIGIVAAIMILFSVLGSENAFIDPNAKKDVKKYILDKDTQDEVLGLMKAYTKEFKAGRKKEKKMEKQLESLFSVRSNTLQDFQSIFDDYMQSRKSRQESYTKAILRTKSLITDSEWENMVANMDSKVKKQIKEQEKSVSSVEIINSKMLAQLEKQIDDEERRVQATKIMEETNSTEIAILKKLNAFNYKDSNLLRDRNATEAEYKDAFIEYNNLWQEYFDLYTGAYEQLSALTTDEEWKAIKKFTSKIFE